MPAFRPPKERIDALAVQAVATMEANPRLQVKNAAEARALLRLRLTADLEEEHAIEEEVFRMLQQHGQKIYQENADFQKMLQDGKKILAKKKGFTL